MIQVTADVFSGRSNPSWIVSDEAEARNLLRELAKEPHLLTSDAPVDAGLGLRGLVIESLTDDLAQDFGFTSDRSYLSLSGKDSRSRELADRLLATMTKAEKPSFAAADALPLEATLQDFLRLQLESTSRTSAPDAATPAPAAEAEAEATTAAAPAATCMIEFGAFNPAFWNAPGVIGRNNCYNYASNKRTDTFAQPGRGCGNQYKAITCAEVTRASLCDGLHRRYVCFPDSEKPRYLVAMVVAPGPGFVDFHWYRKQKEGFWGHKPGGTAARNVDNSGHVILDPISANRGPYTQFCGYFYTCRSQRIR